MVLKFIRRISDEKEDYYDSDIEVDGVRLHANLFTVFDGNALGFKERGLDLVMDLMDQAQKMMEDDDLTEGALKRLAPGNE